MNLQIFARVVGHKLFQPDPKNKPDLEVAKVALVIASMSQNTTKATAATIHVDVEATNDEFALGRSLRLTFEDWQQELDLDGREKPLIVGGERFDPKTGESLSPLAGSTISMTGADGRTTTVKGEDFERAASSLARRGRGRANRTKH